MALPSTQFSHLFPSLTPKVKEEDYFG